MYLVDTCVFIDDLRGGAAARQWLGENRRKCSLSYIVYGELLQGAKSSKHSQDIEDIVAMHEVIWSSREIEELGLSVLKQRSRWGLSLLDALIAATAMENDLTLVTHNVKHFKGIEGLKVTPPPYLEE